MSIRFQKLSPQFEALVQAALKEQGCGLGEAEGLARAVLKLSDYYLAQPGQPTPWSQAYTLSAYLSYFMPLNFVRVRDAFREVKRFLPADVISEVWDFGSGLGTTQWVLEAEDWLEPRPLHIVEHSAQAVAEHLRLNQTFPSRWRPKPTERINPAKGALAVFAYSFLEIPKNMAELSRFDHLLIVEPSTRECGRELMEWRTRWLEKGYTPLAPCTHAGACPLLTQSKKDWCHHRVHFDAPEWWLELEEHLPMRNRTVTYSYLLLSRTCQDRKWRGKARVIGDTLEERGKTRQMICRGPEREFLSWLHRHGEPPQIPHGSLIEELEGEVKGSEVRVSSPLKVEP